MNKQRSICVFCGSRFGVRPQYRTVAIELGRLLAHHDVRLVYGGGSVGLMGAIADAVLDAGGDVLGVITRSLVAREVGHHGLNDLVVVDDMHERKARMASEADGFMALPGGLGTLEELFEMLTWSQLGLHTKPVSLLNVDGYFAPLVAMLDHACHEGFVSETERARINVETQVADAVAGLLQTIEAEAQTDRPDACA